MTTVQLAVMQTSTTTPICAAECLADTIETMQSDTLWGPVWAAALEEPCCAKGVLQFQDALAYISSRQPKAWFTGSLPRKSFFSSSVVAKLLACFPPKVDFNAWLN